MTIRFLPAGDTALVVEFGEVIDRDLSDAVLQLSHVLGESRLPGIFEVVPTFRSLLVLYDSLLLSAGDVRREIEGCLARKSTHARQARLIRFPVCYDESCAPDLADVAARAGLSVADVIALHTGTEFHIYMLGFVPGYPYMGDLPEALQLPRRDTPRTKVPAGSVAIATSLTGIYPIESPGGWHLIGKTPVPLFDANRNQPALLLPGDTIRFESISLVELQRRNAADIPDQPVRRNRVMHEAFRIKMPGVSTTVQDMGRDGYRASGVPASGAMDQAALRLANALVRNSANAAALEMLVVGPSFEVLADSLRVAVVGGVADFFVLSGESERRMPAGRSVVLFKGDVVTIGPLGPSLCGYLAIEGGVDVQLVFGSAATYTRGGFGGLDGRALRTDDVVHGRKPEAEPRAELALPAAFDQAFDKPIRVVLGPQDDYFTPEAIERLLSGEYKVSAQSDRMGFRLQGDRLESARGHDIVSDGVLAGSIQVPGDGQPIILMADSQTAGGYPKIATVISSDIPLVARRKPGSIIHFVAVAQSEAEEIRRRQETDFQDLIGRFSEIAGDGGINQDALANANLIGGVISADD